MKRKVTLPSYYDRFIRTLSNKTRLVIIQQLMVKPLTVSELTQVLGLHQTTISHGLKRLLDCGFVFLQKSGKVHIYSLNQKTIKPLLKLMNTHVDQYCKRCCQ